MVKKKRMPINEIINKSSQLGGMKCPKCGCVQMHNAASVISTRHTKSGTITRRRRCRACGNVFTTSEKLK